MQHALLVNFENFGHTTKNKIFRLVKLLADLSTRLKGWNLFTSASLASSAQAYDRDNRESVSIVPTGSSGVIVELEMILMPPVIRHIHLR